MFSRGRHRVAQQQAAARCSRLGTRATTTGPWSRRSWPLSCDQRDLSMARPWSPICPSALSTYFLLCFLPTQDLDRCVIPVGLYPGLPREQLEPFAFSPTSTFRQPFVFPYALPVAASRCVLSPIATTGPPTNSLASQHGFLRSFLTRCPQHLPARGPRGKEGALASNGNGTPIHFI